MFQRQSIQNVVSLPQALSLEGQYVPASATHNLNNQFSRFETGYTILHAILCEDTPVSLSLPLSRLWILLITVACQHKGQERIKVIKLLQELVNRQLAAAESADPGSTGPKLELSALKPLWQLYTTLVKDYGEQLMP